MRDDRIWTSILKKKKNDMHMIMDKSVCLICDTDLTNVNTLGYLIDLISYNMNHSSVYHQKIIYSRSTVYTGWYSYYDRLLC